MLAREIERAKPDSRPISVLVLDTDRFKSFNDRHGVEGGDRILNDLGTLLEGSARLPDTVARTSGGEFALVLPETNKHSAFILAEELLTKIRDAVGNAREKITVSAGVASYPEHGERVGELLGAADEAMRAAKALGRDRAVLYSPEVTKTLGMEGGRRSVESQAQLATVLSLAEALDQRDSSTAKHSQTVGRLCELMADELGFEPDRIQRIRLAGIVHDIGKIGVPDSILRKPGPLTTEEVEQMRRHPEIGARILSAREMDDIRGWVSAHHERPDGKGYPKGIRGEQIPIEAAILAVADAYEAMIADRVYRMAIGPEAAREELDRCSGTQFDPMVVNALIVALDREEVSSQLVPLCLPERRNGGAHHAARPAIRISAGNRNGRTIRASTRTATAVPTATSFTERTLEKANAPIATANRTAAAVICLPLRSSPSTIACESVALSSRASLIRWSRNTP